MKLNFLLVFILMMTFSSALIQAETIQNKMEVAQNKLAALEVSANGRLGVYAVNTVNKQHFDYHADERFPLCSTCKVFGVAAFMKLSESNNNIRSCSAL